jgi:cysteine desulfurase/selenocysteine lyase
VHPSSQPDASKLATPEKTSSGAHAPESGDSYAFGEPRFNGSYHPQGNRPDTRTANANPNLGFPPPEPPDAPDFYFLRGGEASGKTPASCQTYPRTTVPIPRFDVEGVRRDFPALHQLVNGKPLV